MDNKGTFIISLDFELLWGVRDIKSSDNYRGHILSVWNTLPQLLHLFENFNVKGTFATVGFLFTSNKKELLSSLPKRKPQYLKQELSPYNGHFDKMLTSEEEDKFHYASSLVDTIKKYPNQEIGTHTFSHYYCLEKGQTIDDFREDIEAAIELARKKGIELKSLVFPRNQFNKNYLQVINDLGIRAYRGNEKIWFHTATKGGNKDKWFRKGLRFIDSYFNISGHNCYSIEKIASAKPYNIASSRFLRPYFPKLKLLESFKVKRILNSMTYAAKNDKLYHLWWHPHNFGVFEEENFKLLEKIFEHYKFLNKKYNFQSRTMNELSEILSNGKA